MKAHIIENGVVVNTILVDSLNALPGVTLVEATEGSIGWLFDGSVFTNPNAAKESDILTPMIQDMRDKRDQLLKSTVDTLNGIRWESMTAEQQNSWRVYRQALLDVPSQSGFPWTITWPDAP